MASPSNQCNDLLVAYKQYCVAFTNIFLADMTLACSCKLSPDHSLLHFLHFTNNIISIMLIRLICFFDVVVIQRVFLQVDFLQLGKVHQEIQYPHSRICAHSLASNCINNIQICPWVFSCSTLMVKTLILTLCTAIPTCFSFIH